MNSLVPGGRILPRGLQGDVDIALAEHLIERAVREAIGLGRIERLVHHVPHIHLVAEVLHLALNVLLDIGGHDGLIGGRVGAVADGVGRRLRAGGPHQVVAADLHVVAHAPRRPRHRQW